MTLGLCRGSLSFIFLFKTIDQASLSERQQERSLVTKMRLRDELNGYLRLPRKFFGIPEVKDSIPDVGILGIPYDMTSSYMPGCRFGPDAIRNATDGERSHSYPLHIEGSNLTQKSLSKAIAIEDIGDLEVMGRLPESALIDISETAAKLSKHETSLLFLGGDHFISLVQTKCHHCHLKGIGTIATADAMPCLSICCQCLFETFDRRALDKSCGFEHLLDRLEC